MSKHRPLFAKRLAKRYLRPGDAVLEIGAADGVYTQIYANAVGSTGSVMAVEPHRGFFDVLSILQMAQPWISLCDSAVGASNGSATLNTDAEKPKCSSLYGGNVPTLGETYPIQMTTVDTLVKGMKPKPRLIQVDAQGAEAAIIQGASKTLRLPIIWILELWNDGLAQAGASVGDVLHPFKKQGYTIHNIRTRATNYQAVYQDAERRHGGSFLDVLLLPRNLDMREAA